MKQNRVLTSTDCPDALTSQNFTHVLDTLAPGERLVVDRIDDGSLRITIEKLSGNMRTAVPVKNQLVAQLDPEPVHHGWISFSEVEDSSIKQARKDKRLATNEKIREKVKKNEATKEGLEFVLHFMPLDKAVVVQSNMTKYWMFTIGDMSVFTTQNKTPVMYSINGGERIYL